MLVTTILLFVVMRHQSGSWPRLVAALIAVLRLARYRLLPGANVVKVVDGGWVSIVVAFVYDRDHVDLGARHADCSFDKTRKTEIPLDFLADQLAKKPPHLVPGTAVFLTAIRRARRPR